MDRRKSHQIKAKNHDYSEIILMSLSDGAKPLLEIRENFFAFARRMGAFSPTYQHAPEDYENFSNELAKDLNKMIALGWVQCHGEKYALTEIGAQLAEKHLVDLRLAASLVEKLLQPETVSKVGVGVHFALAAIKLPAAILSGSVGLLNDSADTLLDGVSSLMVYFGLRYNKERAINIALVVIMLATGGFGFYEAVRRFFVPFETVVDWLPFLSAIISALACAVLGFYQRYVGLKSGSMALITQSVDSRNHVIVAVTVISGLVASLLHFPLLDNFVGVGIAVLILKTGIELAIEVIRTGGGERTDLSRYELGLTRRYEALKQAQLRDWMLYLVQIHKITQRANLIEAASQTLNFDQYPALKAFGLAGQAQQDERISRALSELFEKGWMAENGSLRVTEAGKTYLRQQAHKSRRVMGHSFIE